MSKVNIAVFVSGGGTNMQAVIDAVEAGKINGEIKLVISSNGEAYALKRAEIHGIKNTYIGIKNCIDETEKRQKIMAALEEEKIGLIILAGYMSILSGEIIERYKNRIINVHPALIPSFCGKGYYGKRVHERVIEYGVKVTGATVHFVDEGTDTGPIISQGVVAVEDHDTAESIAEKVLEVEHQLLPEAVRLYCEGRLSVTGRKVTIKR